MTGTTKPAVDAERAKRFASTPKLHPGDRVAVVSPSARAPSAFPRVHELGLRRLRDELGLVPVEYPTTRAAHATPAERAADLMAAFADPMVRAILATIGGDDQITVLPHLDPDVVRADPKPFVGYSDNTNLLNWLWQIGVIGYHGGSTMVHLGRGGHPHPISVSSLGAALIDGGDLPLWAPDEFGEDEADWADPAALDLDPPMRAHPGWTWHRPTRTVTAPTWGGNLEIVHWNLAANRWMGPVEDYRGCILLAETSEERPSADEVFRMFRNMGERGLLRQFSAMIVGLAKASSFGRRSSTERRTYRDQQRSAILRALADYHPDMMTVFDVDIGHTDPQWVLPYGGTMTIDGPARTITAHYGPSKGDPAGGIL
ncbi:MAG TPA: S66 peptidase family protein [Nakamurella sp.]|jgi:muramoyltetrapeptide carboxypeptidase LdcA involved in peptidoglycan recycling